MRSVEKQAVLLRRLLVNAACTGFLQGHVCVRAVETHQWAQNIVAHADTFLLWIVEMGGASEPDLEASVHHCTY